MGILQEVKSVSDTRVRGVSEIADRVYRARVTEHGDEAKMPLRALVWVAVHASRDITWSATIENRVRKKKWHKKPGV